MLEVVEVVVVAVVAVAGTLVVGGSSGSCLAMGGSRTYGEAWKVAHLAHVHVGVVDEGALGATPLVTRLLHPLSSSPLKEGGSLF